MMLNNFFIGFIEDNAGLFSIPRLISNLKGCTAFVGYPTGLCQDLLTSNQPITFITAHLVAQLVNPIFAYNLIILGGTVLNFLFAFRFFRKLFGRFIAVLLAFILLFSPYLAYQSRSHIDLMQIWPVIWFLDTLFFSRSRHKAIFLGLSLALITGISNYLGYFTILFSSLYLTLTFLQAPQKLANFKKTYKEVTKGVLVFALVSSIFMAPYIKANFFAPIVRSETNVDEKAVNRPFEDFITFSSRPWYYFLPSVDNPFFGKLSTGVLNQLSSSGNYLTQNYFKAEHSASYLGWVNLFFAVIGFFAVRRGVLCQSRIRATKSGPRSESGRDLSSNTTNSNHPNSLILALVVLGLIILTMPPAITLNGITFYTPSYLLYKFFPMFRVTARLGILILFLTLIFTGYGYQSLAASLARKKVRLTVIRSLLIVLALISIAEFFIPLKVTHVGTPPQVYSYLGSATTSNSPVVIYPYDKTNTALFWMNTHKQPFINPRYYENKATNFNSEKFTAMLPTTSGLEKAKDIGAKYIVYFYSVDTSETKQFFDSSPLLRKIEAFEEITPEETSLTFPNGKATSLVRMIEAGSSKTNSAILYKFSK